MAPRHRTAHTSGMEGVATLLGVTLGYAGVVGGVLWAIAEMTGGSGEDRSRR